MAQVDNFNKNHIPKIILGKTQLEVSRIMYGGIVSTDENQENSDKHVAFAIANGVNYFDVAPTYGDAQLKLGNSLMPYRKDVYLACKTRDRDAQTSEKNLEQSLELLHTDYFDVYQLHELSSVADVEKTFAKGGAFEVLLKAKEQGIAKHLGITCHSEEAALRALELYDFETVLFPTNWALNIGKGFGDKIAKTIKEKNIGFLGMKALIHRAWRDGERDASNFPKSWCKPISQNNALGIAAIKYALEMGVDTIVPPGNFESFSFVVNNAKEIFKPLTNDEKNLLEKEFLAINSEYFL